MPPSGTPSCSTVECVPKPCWASACRNGSCALVHSPLNLRLTCSATSPQQQQGGEFNQSKPYADLPAQSFGEGVLGIGARVWVQPWLSFSVVEGVSYNTDVSLYEKTFRENYTQLLNYLAFEVEAAVSSDLSLVGRIHHRSGAFGTSSESPRGAMVTCSACATAGDKTHPSRRAP